MSDILLKIKREYTDKEKLSIAATRILKLSNEVNNLKSQVFSLKGKLGNDEDFRLTQKQINQLKHKGWVKNLLVNERIIELEKIIENLSPIKADNIKISHKKQAEIWQEKYFKLLRLIQNK